jgi:glycosyltransferase involved in cell wall biosynthesis
MPPDTLVSIVVTNHNYGRFLDAALGSALRQTHPAVEVIVVDDASEDESRAILAAYADRIVCVYLDHAGQAAALNAGVARARGEVILLLDADDVFVDTKAATAVAEVRRRNGNSLPTLLCHPMIPIDGDGHRLPGREPAERPDGLEGNLFDFARRHRYLPFAGAPTSALILSRRLADAVFPLRTAAGVTHGADDLIVRAASLVGEVRWLGDELTLYRRHGPNAFGRGRARSYEFHVNQDAFLNECLMAAGREPVIDFFASEYARPFYLQEGDRRAMATLAWKVFRGDPGPASLVFAARTGLMAALPRAAPRAELARAYSARLQRDGGGG